MKYSPTVSEPDIKTKVIITNIMSDILNVSFNSDLLPHAKDTFMKRDTAVAIEPDRNVKSVTIELIRFTMPKSSTPNIARSSLVAKKPQIIEKHVCI